MRKCLLSFFALVVTSTALSDSPPSDSKKAPHIKMQPTERRKAREESRQELLEESLSYAEKAIKAGTVFIGGTININTSYRNEHQ